MDGSPADDVVRNLEVFIRGAIFRSVTLNAQEDKIRKLLGPEDEDALSDYMVDLAHVLSEIIPAAMKHAETLTSLVGDASDSLNNMNEQARSDRVLRPIFDAGGRGSDLMPV